MSYTRVNWINETEGTTTPLNATNLNTMDEGISDLDERVTAIEEGGTGTTDYADLTNKPKINNVELSGNKTNADLGIPTKTSDLTNDSNFVADASYVHTDNNYTSTEKTKLSGLKSVAWTQNVTSGTKIASINIGGTSTDVYAPTSGGGGGHEMIKTIEGVEAITSSEDEHVASAYVIKNYSNRYTASVIATISANSTEVSITDDIFKDDNATFEFMFEPSSANEKITLSAYTLNTTTGAMTITVADAPTVNTRIRVDVSTYR